MQAAFFSTYIGYIYIYICIYICYCSSLLCVAAVDVHLNLQADDGADGLMEGGGILCVAALRVCVLVLFCL